MTRRRRRRREHQRNAIGRTDERTVHNSLPTSKKKGIAFDIKRESQKKHKRSVSSLSPLLLLCLAVRLLLYVIILILSFSPAFDFDSFFYEFIEYRNSFCF